MATGGTGLEVAIFTTSVSITQDTIVWNFARLSSGSTLSLYNDPGTGLYPVVKVDDILIQKTNAAGRYSLAD